MGPLKTFLKTRFPFIVPWWKRFAARPARYVFTSIYKKNYWENDESVSGPGSSMAQTAAIRSFLPSLLDELDCRTLLDIPCGDFCWMKTVALRASYTGGDIVANLIEDNQRKYNAPNRRFFRLDLLKDPLPPSDLVLCRDCLVHLSNSDIFRALANIKASGSTYLLTTTFEDRTENVDIAAGDWRPLNLRLPPFGFPPPLRLLDEKCPWANYRDKRIGLWRVTDIPGKTLGKP